MRNVQRIYIYVMAYTSLVGILSGLINLAQILIQHAFRLGFEVEDFALWAGVLVVTFPLHVGHAWWIARLGRDAEERHASLRKLYIYAILTLGTVLAAVSLYQVLKDLLRAALGYPLTDFTVWAINLLERATVLLGGLILLWYGILLVRQDRDFGREGGWAATWRRLYVFLVGIGGLYFSIVGTIGFLQLICYAIFPPFKTPASYLGLGSWWMVSLADQGATLLIGLLLWRVGWFWEERWSRPTAPDSERRSLLRQAYYYVGIALGLAVFLVALAYLLRQGLLWMFGTRLGPREQWWPLLSLALSALPVGWTVWWTYRHHLLPERLSQKAYPSLVERLYIYLASAVGLAVAWWGIADIIRVLTHAWLWKSTDLSILPAWWHHPLATGIALSAVGLPTWVWHWRQAQQWIHLPDAGPQERTSLLRRIYLYGFALIAGLIVIVDLSRVAQHVWLWILGVEEQRLWGEIVNASGPALTAFLVWGYHMKVIVTDSRVQKQPESLSEAEIEKLQEERERLLQRLKEIEDKLSAMQE